MEKIMTGRAVYRSHYRFPGLAGLALMLAVASASRAEARNLGSFAAADANHDGRVTLQEFEVYESGRLMAADGKRAERFKALSPEQQSALIAQRFNTLDSGDKGYLDQADWNGS
jgi:hypothetical protein